MRNTLILILAVIVTTCLAVPIKTDQEQINDGTAQGTPVLDNKNMTIQIAAKKINNKIEQLAEKSNNKTQPTAGQPNKKVPEVTKESDNLCMPTTEKSKTTSAVTKKTELEKGSDSLNNSGDNTVQPLKSDSSDEELTGLFSSSSTGIMESMKHMWSDMKGMIGFWNKVRAFVKKLTGQKAQ